MENVRPGRFDSGHCDEGVWSSSAHATLHSLSPNRSRSDGSNNIAKIQNVMVLLRTGATGSVRDEHELIRPRASQDLSTPCSLRRGVQAPSASHFAWSRSPDVLPLLCASICRSRSA